MYESKIHQPVYNSEENFILYKFNVTLFFLFIRPLKTYIDLDGIAFYF